MGITPEDAIKMIFECLAELNAEREPALQIPLRPDAQLLGSEVMDSLTFVNLIVALEGRVSERVQKAIVLVNEEAFQGDLSPFQNVAALAQYVSRLSNHAPAGT